MGQRQIQSLNLLAMGADDLREEIYAQAEKNPALEIEDDDFESGVKNVRVKTSLASDYLRVGSASAIRVKKFTQETYFTSARVPATGFVPPVPLEEGLRRTIDYEFVRRVDGHTFCGE